MKLDKPQKGKRPTTSGGSRPESTQGTRANETRAIRRQRMSAARLPAKLSGAGVTQPPQFDEDFDDEFESHLIQHYNTKIRLVANQRGQPPFSIDAPPGSLATYGSYIPTLLQEFQQSKQTKGSQWVTRATAVANNAIDGVLKKLRPVARAASIDKTPAGQFRKSVPVALRTTLHDNFKASFTPSGEPLARYVVVQVFLVLKRIRFREHGLNSDVVTYFFGGQECGSAAAAYVSPFFKDNTHLCPFLFEETVPPWSTSPNLQLLASTLVHEAAHRLFEAHDNWMDWGCKAIWEVVRSGVRIATARDISPFPDVYKDHKAFKRMSVGKSLLNPDSYSNFIFEALNDD